MWLIVEPADMVRFYWRADVQKKAKIMRKVKFPLDLDVTELVNFLMRLPIGSDQSSR